MSMFVVRGGQTINNIYYVGVATSVDGVNWSTPVDPGVLAQSGKIHTGQGLFLAQNPSARPGGTAAIAASADGVNWSYRYSSNGTALDGPVVYGANKFFNMDYQPFGIYPTLSSDGSTWIRTGSSISGITESLTSACDYGNGIYAFGSVGNSYGDAAIWVTGNDGVSFTEKLIQGSPTSSIAGTGIYTIAYLGPKWVGLKTVAGNFPARNYVYAFESSDNTGTFTGTTTPFYDWNANPSSTITGNTVYALGRTAAGGHQVAKNAGATGWTNSDLPTVSGATQVAYSDITAIENTVVVTGLYVMGGVTYGLIVTSLDGGVTWTRTDGNAWTVPIWSAANNAPIVDEGPFEIASGTISQYTDIQATLSYNAPATTGYDALTLYRVTKDFRFGGTGQAFPIPPKSIDGLPYYQNAYDPANPGTIFTTQPGQLPYHEEIIEEWGKVAVLINNEDVTFFRGGATVVENVSWQSFGNFETASIFLPTVTMFDNLGVARPNLTSGTGGGLLPGSLSWLYDSAPVEIKRILPDGSQTTIWLGSVNNLQVESNGVGMRVSAHGLIYDANHQVLPGPINENTVARANPQDVGLLTADVLNSIDGRWSYAQPIAVGIDTIKVPNWDNALEFLRNLAALGTPELWIDENGKPYVNGRPNGSRPASTIDIIAGQEGVELELAHDGTAPATVIYGSGSLPGGTVWRNVVYAYPSPSNPSYEALRWPFDDPNTLMILGMKNADTITNYGVTSLCNRLIALGRLSRTYTVYNRTIETAVKNLQDDWGFDDTGKVDYKLWSRLINVSDVTQGAHIEPLYISPLVDPTSPSYDPTVRRVETYMDFGSDITVDEAKVVAEQIAMRDMIQYNTTGTPIYKQNKSITGTIGMTICPVGYSNPATSDVSRWDIKPGDSVRIWGHVLAPIPADTHTYPAGTTWEGGDSAGSVLLYVKRIEWDLAGTPKAILTVSSRDLEYSELDAAQERVRVSNAEEALVKKVKKAKRKK